MASGTSACDRVRRRFDPLVVTRGDLYALRGAVSIVAGFADRVSAIVRGTLPYDVSIVHEPRDGSPLLLASCTCAHGARSLCKHAWAVLRVAERHGHLGDAVGEGELVMGTLLGGPDRRPDLRWVIDLSSKESVHEPPVDVFEQSTSPLGFSTGFRKVKLAPRSYERTLLPGDRPPDIVSLARTQKCEVRLVRGETTEPLVVDEGALFRVVLTIRDGGGSPTSLPSLVVSGELRRDDERIPLDTLTAVFRSGIAFLGARALRIETHVPFRWTDALQKRSELLVSEEEARYFLRELVRKCPRSSFELPESITLEERAPLVTRVHVRKPSSEGRKTGRMLRAELVFDYDGAKVAWRDTNGLAIDVERRRIVVRDADAEQRAFAEVLAAGFDRVGSPREDRTLKIPSKRLATAIRILPADGFVVEADGIVHRRASRTSLSLKSGIDWFDLLPGVEFDGVAVPMPALLDAARRGDSLVRLGDGTMGVLPEAWLTRVLRIMDLGEAHIEECSGVFKLRFRRTQLTLVDVMLGEDPSENDNDAVAWDRPLATLRGELSAFADLGPAEVPAGFRGELRDYQRVGLAWMHWLERVGFSGCLADDMGLGKTVQVLALLASRRERASRTSRTSLIVAPRSVVFNWIEEARRFTPDLRVIELDARTSEAELRAADVAVTTYGVIRGRAAGLRKTPFDYVILDEAHAIKSDRGATTQAVRLLASQHRLALTGTPVENHLGELASLFDFLNPGMLGSGVRKTARRGLDIDPELTARLGRGLRPFVLRRKKADVLKELPPRIDQALLCSMASEQRAVYDRVKKHYQAELLGTPGRLGRAGEPDAAPFVVLEALLRLRQIACHPGLVDPARRKERSAKLDVLLERLLPLARDGKKALVFSQFTRLLDIVGAELEAHGVRFARLDGTTRDRQAVVERFQTDPACHAFLISLKAGGVGLNLTAAEYVFILDPWWNPAAEAQAIDRAHRFGQTKSVVAYRLLCKDSIDERVAELQAKKRALVASVFDEPDGLRLGMLSVKDVAALLS